MCEFNVTSFLNIQCSYENPNAYILQTDVKHAIYQIMLVHCIWLKSYCFLVHVISIIHFTLFPPLFLSNPLHLGKLSKWRDMYSGWWKFYVWMYRGLCRPILWSNKRWELQANSEFLHLKSKQDTRPDDHMNLGMAGVCTEE